MLTPAQQDYIEAIHRLEGESSPEDSREGVRISAIAARLGTRQPTVTRTVRQLREAGLLDHESRGLVRLTDRGRALGREMVHRHEDLIAFFTEVLGLPRPIAERDTCQVEHGLSSEAAERLHQFMEFVERMPVDKRETFREFKRRFDEENRQFNNIPPGKQEGWRI